MKFKIVRLIQDDKISDSPEGSEGFMHRIEMAAESYAKQGWHVISLSFPCEEEARLFLIFL